MGEIVQIQVRKRGNINQNIQLNQRDLYVIDFDGVLAYCFDPEAEAKTHFMTLKYIKRNPNWHLLIDDMALLEGGADFIILTARHPNLAQEISEMCYGWQVIGRDFDLDVKKLQRQPQPIDMDKWMRNVVRFKRGHLIRFAKQRPRVYFLDDDWKWYENAKLKENVVLLKPSKPHPPIIFENNICNK